MGDALKRDTSLQYICKMGEGDFGLMVRENEHEGFSHVATERRLK